MVEHNTWEKKEELGNAEKVLEEFEERMNAEVRRAGKVRYSRRKRL